MDPRKGAETFKPLSREGRLSGTSSSSRCGADNRTDEVVGNRRRLVHLCLRFRGVARVGNALQYIVDVIK